MLRFCDLREAYWLDKDCAKGPIAFIDTVSDTFVALDGKELFDDFSDLLECAAHDMLAGRITEAYLGRLVGLVPETMR